MPFRGSSDNSTHYTGPFISQIQLLSSCLGPSARTCGGTARWTGCSCLKLFSAWSTPILPAPELMKDWTAARAFTDNKPHGPGSCWELKLSPWEPQGQPFSASPEARKDGQSHYVLYSSGNEGRKAMKGKSLQ